MPRDESFGPVLSNRHFRAVWLAQWLAQTAQNAIHFIQMVLIERLTGSAMHLGLVILAFTLPGVIFSPIAGVMVDRFSKKQVMAISNLGRALLGAGYVLVVVAVPGSWKPLAIYALAFASSTLGQFFAPAEASMIPLLVGEGRLLAANSLFNVTMALSQVVGLLILGPLAVSLAQEEGGFLVVTAMYLAAAALVSRLPADRPAPAVRMSGMSRWRQVWADARAGWQFVSASGTVRVAMLHLVTVATLIMVMAMLAPGYAARVLGLAPQDAIIVFVPAGAGMMLATGLAGRWGHVLERLHFAHIGMAITGIGFAALGLISMDYQRFVRPILQVYPHATFSLTTTTMALAFILGISLSVVNILAQTTVQKESPPAIRGRVFSVQFMLSNLVGIPPLLVLGGLADTLGIPRVLGIVGAGAVTMSALGILMGSRYQRTLQRWPVRQRPAAPHEAAPANRAAPPHEHPPSGS